MLDSILSRMKGSTAIGKPGVSSLMRQGTLGSPALAKPVFNSGNQALPQKNPLSNYGGGSMAGAGMSGGGMSSGGGTFGRMVQKNRVGMF